MEEKKKRGFTLIELLVVVAIIALILAIVIPVPDRGRPSARRVVCEYNIRQLCLGFHLFHEENEIWPYGERWCDSVKPYHEEKYGSLYLCPFDKTGPCSFAMNENIPADAEELPPDLVLLFESTPGWNQTGGPDDVVIGRHGKKNPRANIAFGDGHVDFVESEAIPNLRWTLEAQKRGASTTR